MARLSRQTNKTFTEGCETRPPGRCAFATIIVSRALPRQDFFVVVLVRLAKFGRANRAADAKGFFRVIHSLIHKPLWVML
jgi:hypothetical protein